MSRVRARSATWRVEVYARMNGHAKRLTPKQRRRMIHKVNRSIAPFGKKAAA